MNSDINRNDNRNSVHTEAWQATLSHGLTGENSERDAQVTDQNVLCSIIHAAIAAQEETLGLQNCWKATSMNSVVTHINGGLELLEGCFDCSHPE